MSFRPIDMILARVELARSDSDTAFFHELLYAGEFIIKITAAALVALINDDRERHRYRLIHTLVRADGIGEWARVIDDALTGSSSQHILDTAKDDRRVFVERLGYDTWQHHAVSLIQNVLRCIDPAVAGTPARVALRAWFSSFVELRNKTRGHGAPTAAACSSACPELEESIRLLCENNVLFKRPWAYLHRNLSGKYRVVSLGGNASAFEDFKTSNAINLDRYNNGIYMSIGAPRLVELVRTNLDVSDFYFPNGAFNGKRFELHSLITDSRLEGDASPYLASASELPQSETHGRGQLEIVLNVFSNIPAVPSGYVRRQRLEGEIVDVLMNDRHPIVTLLGRGGIGKTSLALNTLHNVAETDRYTAIIWLSARDIDLSLSGPKSVQPQVLTEEDIANEFVKLLELTALPGKNRSAIDIMAANLRESSIGGPILFVFDNFETVRSPIDLFQWIDANIRLPNKAMITSRFRDFKADYPINVNGMERTETDELISRTAKTLSIDGMITENYKEQLFEESDGHPYVIKIILGEVADKKLIGKPARLISQKDDILGAIFERTFASLSPIASRIFLTLSGWRSLVPQLALEEVVLREQSERVNPASGVEELLRMSLVQRNTAADGTDFLDVPLTAAIFGFRKLGVSPIRIVIENDIRLLRDLGPTSSSSLRDGIRPRIESLFRKIASRISERNTELSSMRPVLEFVAQSYPPAWLLLADLQEELPGEKDVDAAAEYVRRYLEREPEGSESREAWERLAELYRLMGNVVGACGAFVRAFSAPNAPMSEISNMANWLNNHRDAIASMDAADLASVFGALAGLMDRRIAQLSAIDLSRLAWLHLHAGNEQRARAVAELGLAHDAENIHCQRLVDRLPRIAGS